MSSENPMSSPSPSSWWCSENPMSSPSPRWALRIPCPVPVSVHDEFWESYVQSQPQFIMSSEFPCPIPVHDELWISMSSLIWRWTLNVHVQSQFTLNSWESHVQPQSQLTMSSENLMSNPSLSWRWALRISCPTPVSGHDELWESHVQPQSQVTMSSDNLMSNPSLRSRWALRISYPVPVWALRLSIPFPLERFYLFTATGIVPVLRHHPLLQQRLVPLHLPAGVHHFVVCH